VQAGRKKNWRQKGICKKKESRTADREEYTGRRNEGLEQGRICREEEAGQQPERNEGQEAGENMQEGGKKHWMETGKILRQEE
jgi:hypothetical protein